MVYFWINLIFLAILSLIIFIVVRPKSIFPNIIIKHDLIYFYSPIFLALLNLILTFAVDTMYLYFAILYFLISVVINTFSRIIIKKAIFNEEKLIFTINGIISGFFDSELLLKNHISFKKRHGINDNKTAIIKFDFLFDELNLSIDELIKLQLNISSELNLFVEFQFKDIILKENSYVYYYQRPFN